jgi:DNA repair protein RadC
LTFVIGYDIILLLMTPKSINIAVAEQVEKLGSDKVITAVVDKLVTAEVTKRADALAAAVKLSEDTLRELRKASKADQVSISADGTKVETFSQKAFEAKKKLEEKLAKIDVVVTNATEKSEWGKLYELVKGSGGAQSEGAKADDTTTNS